MLNRRSFLSVQLLGLLLAGSAAFAAAPARRGPAGPPSDYVPRLDGAMVTATAADGQEWAVWAYRSSGEFDVAIAARGAAGTWSAPSFVGRRDGIDQIDPAVAVDANGSVYVAYATSAPQRVYLTTLPAGSATWSTPQLLSAGEFGSTPGVRVVGDRLVIAYRTGRGVRVFDVALVVAPNQPEGIQDGPDGIDPLGNSGTSELPGGDGGDRDPNPPPPEDEGGPTGSN